MDRLYASLFSLYAMSISPVARVFLIVIIDLHFLWLHHLIHQLCPSIPQFFPRHRHQAWLQSSADGLELLERLVASAGTNNFSAATVTYSRMSISNSISCFSASPLSGKARDPSASNDRVMVEESIFAEELAALLKTLSKRMRYGCVLPPADLHFLIFIQCM